MWVAHCMARPSSAALTVMVRLSIATSGEEAVLHSFARGAHDGGLPMGRLLYANGMLYGTTAYGGKNDGGTVFSMTLDGKEKLLHSFGSTFL